MNAIFPHSVVNELTLLQRFCPNINWILSSSAVNNVLITCEYVFVFFSCSCAVLFESFYLFRVYPIRHLDDAVFSGVIW